LHVEPDIAILNPESLGESGYKDTIQKNARKSLSYFNYTLKSFFKNLS